MVVPQLWGYTHHCRRGHRLPELAQAHVNPLNPASRVLVMRAIAQLHTGTNTATTGPQPLACSDMAMAAALSRLAAS
jgi:hypothetical protein